MNLRWKCEECGEITDYTHALKALHPFEAWEEILGCPDCNGVRLSQLCDEPGCESLISCSTPVDGGYRYTCHEHRPDPPRDLSRVAVRTCPISGLESHG